MNTHDVGNKNSPEQGNEVVNLAEAVTALLIEAGHTHPQYWLAGLHPDAINSPDQNIQRFLINRYWRMQIQSLPEDTMDVRYCLVDERNIRPADWLRIFRKGVLPCIMKHNLPKLPH